MSERALRVLRHIDAVQADPDYYLALEIETQIDRQRWYTERHLEIQNFRWDMAKLESRSDRMWTRQLVVACALATLVLAVIIFEQFAIAAR